MHVPSLFVVTLLVPAAAQSFVSPAHFATVEAPSNSSVPFGYFVGPIRYQQIHDDVPPRTLTGLAFRHETNGQTRAAYSLTLDVFVSTAATTAATASTTFATNHGTDRLQVVTNRTLTVPGNDPSQLPSPFTLAIPFDAGVDFPFARGASLCWEVQVTAWSTTAVVLFDAVLVPSIAPPTSWLAGTRSGLGCLATGRTAPMTATPANSVVDWNAGTGTFRVNGSQLQSGGVFGWITGTSTTQWNGLPLPSVLPSTLGAPSGACTLYTDLGLLTVATASGSGTAQLALPFVPTAALHGTVLCTQVLGLDATANALGLTTSNLVQQQVVQPDPLPGRMARVFAVGSLAATGTLETNGCLVTRFD
jgi:hypothetical protein